MIDFNTPKEEQLLALINGVQQNIMIMAVQLEQLQLRVKAVEDKQNAKTDTE